MQINDSPLTINEWSRSGEKLKGVKGIVIHWLANTMQEAADCRTFFEMRKLGKDGYGGAHYIVGLHGEVLRCIPEDEVAYHVGSTVLDPQSQRIYTDLCRQQITSGNPNDWTIGVEHCHIDDNGVMALETVNSSIELCATLCVRYGLNPLSDLFLHKEVVGWKNCHRFYVDHPAEWAQFKHMVAAMYKVQTGKYNS